MFEDRNLEAAFCPPFLNQLRICRALSEISPGLLPLHAFYDLDDIPGLAFAAVP